MSRIWIYQTNKQTYIDLMNMECGGSHIHQETEDKLQVDFCNAAMTVWVQAGYWYSFEQ